MSDFLFIVASVLALALVSAPLLRIGRAPERDEGGAGAAEEVIESSAEVLDKSHGIGPVRGVRDAYAPYNITMATKRLIYDKCVRVRGRMGPRKKAPAPFRP